MTPRDFCYWLQGYIELASADGTPVVSKGKVECIQKNLAMVFTDEIDPTYGDGKIQKKPPPLPPPKKPDIQKRSL